ncbi:MAG: aminodeoxychorismate synthase component I [Opitutaceae bacterium]|nr:aminodeoxychorismate synthase component I [Opitutaceae bacterium]
MLLQEVEFGVGPEELFDVLCDRPPCFFLDSALSVGGLGRFSFIGFDPFVVFCARGDEITLTQDGRTEMHRGDVILELRRLFERYCAPASTALPFASGAVGYFSYEFGLRFEGIARSSADDLGIPEVELGLYDGVLAFDLASKRTFIVANSVAGSDEQTIVQRVESTVRGALIRGRAARPEMRSPAAVHAPRANFTKETYLGAIVRIKDYIAAGDVYQVNLSQRFEMPLPCHPYELYRRLRRRSPAPFASYLNFGERQMVSSSPERFLRLQNGRVETRPIKGTRRRGTDRVEDAELGRQLLASDKDRAELLMIVDLERNDLGRVCEFGSIRVDELYRLETHPTVFHLVATVSGRLRPGADIFDCLRAAFPGGSITGAPKIRAMQIIDELEPHRRHIYSGAIGCIGFDGNCDLNIAIRTIQCVGGRAYYHVGGGIVWDSDPESEYQETLDKGCAMHAALVEELRL